ncbi:hypothetical protein MOUN0_D01706 [Monosporozyma unispora]|nr:hypothetical protein C6P44_002539 [Kazachstania unispora]
MSQNLNKNSGSNKDLLDPSLGRIQSGKGLPKFDISKISSSSVSSNNTLRDASDLSHPHPSSSLSVESSTAESSSPSLIIPPSQINPRIPATSSISKGLNQPPSMDKTVESLHTFNLFEKDPYQEPISRGSATSLKEFPKPQTEMLDPRETSLSEQASIKSSLAGGLKGIHGSTKRIAEVQNLSKRWDWNILPMNDAQCLIKTPKYNIINIEIDGQIKQLKYVPSYNNKLALLDIFCSFNKESKTSDSLKFSKERLRSCTQVVVKALRIKKEVLSLSDQDSISPKNNVLISLSKSSVVDSYVKDDDEEMTDDRSQVDIVIHLWHLQLQKFLLQKNSLFYSNEALQNLMQRKALSRKSIKQQRHHSKKDSTPIAGENVLYIQPVDDGEAHKVSPVISDNIDEIDILVVRPPLAYLTGLQLAYDEPSLNVADFQINSISWLSTSISEDTVLDTTAKIGKDHLSKVKIVSEESELEYLSKSNADQYIVDCLGRQYHEGFFGDDNESIGNSSDSSGLSESTTELFSALPQLVKEESSNTSMRFSSNPSLAESTGSIKEEHPLPKKKPSNKKSSIVNFFRRKHHQHQPEEQQSKQSLIPPTLNKQTSQSTVTTSNVGSSARSSVRKYNPSISRSFQSSRYSAAQDPSLHQTLWLEDHFTDMLSNYKRIDMPTQYYLPKDCGSPLSPNVSSSEEDLVNKTSTNNASTNKSEENIKTGTSYNQQFLQLRLPFADNSIPAIYCPWVWGILPRKRWHVLAKELFRIVESEGYVLAVQSDISPTNTNPVESKFKTALEKEKIFDSVAINAINQNLFIHPTKHLSNIFKEHGFTNIKASSLSLKLGDCVTEMGCLNEFACLMAINFVFRHEMDHREGESKDPAVVLEQYIEEHWGKIDDNAGTFRISYVIAQKPKKIINI